MQLGTTILSNGKGHFGQAKMTRPVKVDHLQSWFQKFWSDQIKMNPSIWCNNRNLRNFGLNGKSPWRSCSRVLTLDALSSIQISVIGEYHLKLEAQTLKQVVMTSFSGPFLFFRNWPLLKSGHSGGPWSLTDGRFHSNELGSLIFKNNKNYLTNIIDIGQNHM